MKKLLTALVLCLFCLSIPVIAQEKALYINYERKFIGDSYTHALTKVIAQKTKVIYFEKLKKFIKRYVEKDVQQQEIKQYLWYEKLTLKEELNLFNWQLQGETKEILGYKCNRAITSFRGREFVAYFTSDLPFNAAPWKFYGLPGVVLEVYSTDGVFRWTAQKLEVKPYVEELENPLTGLPVINLDKYCELIKKEFKNYDEMILKYGEKVYVPDPFHKYIEYFDFMAEFREKYKDLIEINNVEI